MSLVNYTYERDLAEVYHRIDKRGIFVNEARRTELRDWLRQEIDRILFELSIAWKRHVYIGKENDNKSDNSVNINSSGGKRSLLNSLKDLGYDVPKIRKKNKETDEIEMAESANDLALHRLFADTGDQNIGKLLVVREYNTMYVRYACATLYNDTFFCCYSVAGTLTGRRSSKKCFYNIGGNAQTFPKRHKELAYKYRRCLVARSGRIFFNVDQMSAEEWPVQALAGSVNGLQELKDSSLPGGISRHSKLAALIFNVPVSAIKKGSLEYAVGKKGRHANNYGMRPRRFSEQCAQEGFALSVETCKVILDKINKADPQVDAVFHKYVKEQLFSERTLRTPLGRERQFFGLRPNDDNIEILNEAFSYIPQSTVGDNTGLAVLYLDRLNDYVVQEGHDSIIQEVPDEEQELLRVFRHTKAAFDRDIKFDNGITINIPIEGELGYDLANMKPLKAYTEEELLKVYREVKEQNATKMCDSLA